MKIKEITSTRKVYSDNCPICKKEIKAFSESNLEYNMRLHKETHISSLSNAKANSTREEIKKEIEKDYGN